MFMPAAPIASTATRRVGHAARRHERNLQFLGGTRQQDHVRHIVFTGMSAALKTVDADRIAADRLGLQGMTDRGAFVDYLDIGSLERRHVLLRAAAGGLDDLDAAFPDRSDVFRIGRRREGRQEGQVHAERFVRHIVTAGDLLGEQFRCPLRQTGDDAEAAGIRHRRGQFREADIMHAALNDGVLDTEHFSDRCFHEFLRC
jgi:hypothetical protein